MKTLHLEVLTPQATLLEQDVTSLVVPLLNGWLGVFPGHAPFQARLLPGEVIFRSAGQERMMATLGGTLVTDGDRATILTGVAMLDHDLDVLEQRISEEAEQLTKMEEEAEKHFDRVYRQMAHTFKHRRGHYR
jgi:F-type H+-transporting ATPase subunit epsilon